MAGTADGLPDHLGRYEILGVLGHGSMGVVYKARDPQLDRLVALKAVRADLGLATEILARFQQEAQAAGRLSHPGIVAIHDVIDLGGGPGLVMEYVDGRTLADRLGREGPLPPLEAVALIRQVAASLAYAHAHGVVHRDIKPSNVLITADGVAKLSDFGIARIAGREGTQTGVMAGTPAYMAPERLRGAGSDARCDLFALGVVLYEALTGVHPFRGEELATTLYNIAHTVPVLASRWTPKVSPALSAVLERALAKAPDHRYANAEAFAAALADASQSGSVAGPTAWRGVMTRIGRARLGIIGWAVAVSVVALSIGGESLGTEGRARDGIRPEPDVRAAAPLGSMVVWTNPSVDVFLDGTLRERTSGGPVTLAAVPPGERIVTLRFGAREQPLHGRVQAGQTLALRYYFADDLRPSPPRRIAGGVPHPSPPGRLESGGSSPSREETLGAVRRPPEPSDGPEGRSRQGEDPILKIAGTLSEGIQQVRKTFEAVVSRLGEGGGPPPSAPPGPRPSTGER